MCSARASEVYETKSLCSNVDELAWRLIGPWITVSRLAESHAPPAGDICCLRPLHVHPPRYTVQQPGCIQDVAGFNAGNVSPP